jgi:hemerythrin
MAIVAWNDSYLVNIKIIDSQHKQLFDLLNQLHDAMMMGQGQEGMGIVLNSLVSYTASHFSEEERLFKEYGYPDTERHMKEHQEFVQQVLDFQAKFATGTAPVTIKILSFLRDWIQNHINGNDKKYSGYLNAKGVN